MKILISAANADVCLSMARIIRSDPFYRTAHVIGLTPDSPWPARQYFDDVLAIPMVHESGYEAALIRIINELKPDVFIPFSEAELSWFARNPDVLSRLKIKVIINPAAILRVFLDKKDTANYLQELGVAVPVTYDPVNLTDNQLPVIMKPRRSAGSKNMAVIRNALQLRGFREQFKAQLGDFVAQELIDVHDAEFTCGLWRCGTTLRHCTFRRRLQGGMTGFARVEQDAAIDATLEKIAASLDGDFFINVQLRLRGGVPYVFEINPRFSSTVMMRHRIGFSDFIWTLDHHFQRSKPPVWGPPVGTVIFRVSDECVVNAEGIKI